MSVEDPSIVQKTEIECSVWLKYLRSPGMNVVNLFPLFYTFFPFMVTFIYKPKTQLVQWLAGCSHPGRPEGYWGQTGRKLTIQHFLIMCFSIYSQFTKGEDGEQQKSKCCLWLEEQIKTKSNTQVTGHCRNGCTMLMDIPMGTDSFK